MGLIKQVQNDGYEVVLLFLSLLSSDLALQRVKTRVNEGGHNIPEEVIKRRFENGLKNLFNLYIPIVDKWLLVNNSGESFNFVAEGTASTLIVKNQTTWELLKTKYDGR